jgi:abortive infection bacteriophage resistance protein
MKKKEIKKIAKKYNLKWKKVKKFLKDVNWKNDFKGL